MILRVLCASSASSALSLVLILRFLRMRQPVEQPLQDIGGGNLVDDLGAALARKVGLDHLTLDGGGGEALVPESDGPVHMLEQVLGELAHALGTPALVAVPA